MQYCAVYINQGLNAHREAFSPAIIIEELLLQRFLHTLEAAASFFIGSLSIVGVGFVKVPPQFYEKGPFYV